MLEHLFWVSAFVALSGSGALIALVAALPQRRSLMLDFDQQPAKRFFGVQKRWQFLRRWK